MATRDIEMQIKHGAGQVIGYRRVSTGDQVFDRQQLPQCDRVFEEKISGASKARPALEEMMRFVRDGDTVVVHSIDRLARSLIDLQSIVDELVDKGVSVQFLKENLMFSQSEENATGKLMLQVLGAISEFERSLIKSRQKEGIEKAKARNAYKDVGRPRKIDKQRVINFWSENTDLSISQISKILGYSTSSVQRALATHQAYRDADKRINPSKLAELRKRAGDAD